GVPATAPYNVDEEASGILDMEDILGAGNFIMVDQSHYAIPGELVEGGQFLKLYNPETYKSSQIITFIEDTDQTESIAGFTLYPNPANNEAIVSLNLNKAENLTINFFDMKGNQVLSGVQKSFGKGVNQVILNTSGLENGIYMVQISTGSKTTRIKTVILH
ncbi:MAG: T9SS type A sorting domain-containing protein, partial [Opitutaceae bacterium]|nr:T9SS type A sorting domain-containing protein [Cytophagales bacterium]